MIRVSPRLCVGFKLLAAAGGLERFRFPPGLWPKTRGATASNPESIPGLEHTGREAFEDALTSRGRWRSPSRSPGAPSGRGHTHDELHSSRPPLDGPRPCAGEAGHSNAQRLSALTAASSALNVGLRRKLRRPPARPQVRRFAEDQAVRRARVPEVQTQPGEPAQQGADGDLRLQPG